MTFSVGDRIVDSTRTVISGVPNDTNYTLGATEPVIILCHAAADDSQRFDPGDPVAVYYREKVTGTPPSFALLATSSAGARPYTHVSNTTFPHDLTNNNGVTAAEAKVTNGSAKSFVAIMREYAGSNSLNFSNSARDDYTEMQVAINFDRCAAGTAWEFQTRWTEKSGTVVNLDCASAVTVPSSGTTYTRTASGGATIGSATVAVVEYVVFPHSTFLEGILSATASGSASFAAPTSAAASVVSSATGTVAAVTYTRTASGAATIGSATEPVVEYVVEARTTSLEAVFAATSVGSASFAGSATAAASVVSSATGTVGAVTYTRTASGGATIGSATIALASFAGSATAAASVVSSATGTVGAVTYTRTATGAATIGSATIAALAYQGTATSDASFTLPTSTVSVIYELPATSAATLVSTAVGTVAGVETPTASMTFDRPTVSFFMVLPRPASAFASVISTVTGELGQFGSGAASLSSTGSVAVTVDYSRPASSAATISASSSTSINDLAPSVLEAVIAHVTATATRILPSQSVSISAAMVVSSGRQPVGPSDPLQKSVSVHGISATTSESQIPVSISCIVVDTVSVTFGATVPVSGTVSTTASSTGGAIDFDGDLEASFSSSASVAQGSGSRFFAQVIIDGVGSLGTGLTGTLPGGATIDGIGSISAPLLTEGEAVTVVQIWNVALVELGVGTIGTTSDGSSQAILLNTVWEGGFRAQFLADHAWNGAKRTIDLETFNDSAGDAIAPSGPRWAKAYNLPDDYLRALTINGLPMQPNGGMGQNQWEIEVVSDGATPPTLKRCLLSNSGTISLEYVMDIGADIYLLSPLVAHAMGLALAAHVATNFGKPPTEQAYIAQRAADALLAAKGVDGQESSPRMFSSTSLLDVRR